MNSATAASQQNTEIATRVGDADTQGKIAAPHTKARTPSRVYLRRMRQL